MVRHPARCSPPCSAGCRTYPQRRSVMQDTPQDAHLAAPGPAARADLPPLPAPESEVPGGEWPEYSERQMREYARAAVLADRERAAMICDRRAQDCEADFASDGDERWLVYAKHARKLAAEI